jgi:hypothetical protein
MKSRDGFHITGPCLVVWTQGGRKYSKDGKIDGKEWEGMNVSLYLVRDMSKIILLVTSRGGDAHVWRCMGSAVS